MWLRLRAANKVYGLIQLLMLATCLFPASKTDNVAGTEPGFSAPIANVTAPVSREAILACTVRDLSVYKVAWLRVDTQTILTIQNHVITKSRRIGVTHSDHRTWFLHIRELRESDRGWYMCQINTDPMKSQVGYLDVIVPPDIVDEATSPDQVVSEGSPASLICTARGSPVPQITWKREHGLPITLDESVEVTSVDGPVLNISRVSREHMGGYLCIASNGVPPTVSKRIRLVVQFPPLITITNQLVGAATGSDVTLECIIEAYPKSINYWTKESGTIVPQEEIEDPYATEYTYKTIMKLTIKNVSHRDYGSYKCVAKNSLGDTEGSVKIYEIPPPVLEQKKGHAGMSSIVDDSIKNAVVGSQDLKYERSRSSFNFNQSHILIVVYISIMLCTILS